MPAEQFQRHVQALRVRRQASDTAGIGLTEDKIAITVRSRLRTARLYSEGRDETRWTRLEAWVHVVGPAYNIQVLYLKPMRDEATAFIYRHPSWEAGVTGTYGRSGDYLLSGAAELMDEFIDEYLRVNAEACE